MVDSADSAATGSAGAGSGGVGVGPVVGGVEPGSGGAGAARESFVSQASQMSGPEVAELLGLQPLAEEGGLWAQTYRDQHSTAIYYLLCGGEVSKMHRLSGPEIYHWYLGAPLELVLLYPDGSHAIQLVGPDLTSGHRPQVPVPGGVWQGSSSIGSWTLLGTTMSPPYRQEDFTLGDRTELIQRWPAAEARIIALT